MHVLETWLKLIRAGASGFFHLITLVWNRGCGVLVCILFSTVEHNWKPRLREIIQSLPQITHQFKFRACPSVQPMPLHRVSLASLVQTRGLKRLMGASVPRLCFPEAAYTSSPPQHPSLPLPGPTYGARPAQWRSPCH